MIESPSLPGDPTELHLCISYDDELRDTPQADTLERWNVAVLHRRRTHDGGQSPEQGRGCATAGSPSCTTEDVAVGEMTSYRVHLNVGSALLVMDRVTLDPQWRGHGLAAVLGIEAIHRLMPGCRAIACSPGITDLSSQRLTDRSEWDRVNAKIAQEWERIGFRLYRDNIYLLSPSSQDLEEQRGVLRGRLAELGASWKSATSAPSQE
ncbi:hypothetical protein OG266_38775 [Streptomyces sp. NBC_00554]|uniref:hypothetical protein n=1 Tax=Streptomyces sp. NBC_00554 TaxID=2903661 RepID=UPI00352C9FE7|nr:hypothetical protein OG266_38775 [Streptomyces sp. NBC_00554]